MNSIKCPKCGTVFQIDETDYESIVKQIRDAEFHKEIDLREEQYKKDKESAIKIAEANLEKILKEDINKKTLEIASLRNELKNKEEQMQNELSLKFNGELSKKDLEINELKNRLKIQEREQEFQDFTNFIERKLFIIKIYLRNNKQVTIKEEDVAESQRLTQTMIDYNLKSRK